MTENEVEDPVGAPDDPLAVLTAAAVDAGLVRAGDKPDQNVIDFWMRAIDAAATVADEFKHPEVAEDTVGDVIRSRLYE